LKYRQNIGLSANNGYHLTEFHFFDQNNEEIRL
jgi:ribonuclease G